ncbi:MAG TPA: ABC transporter permease, partial [Chromatiales bacterium]|nr:ABC transporter permease [Chromatiales bacterium]
LFVSARSDNQIVSLIVTTLICGVFYLVGSDTLTALVGNQGAELFKLFGTGSRFESITRGVIDMRDLYYYLSIVAVFLTLNVLTLERIRWTPSGNTKRHRVWLATAGLLIANFAVANAWLQQVTWARADITEGRIYSISNATRGYLAQLQEPLLIRGYFSAQTHPLLAPLVPQLKDLLKEYEVASDGRVRVEFVDPLENPELEKEAGEKYGIKPVAFQTTSKYSASLVNSYFDVVVQYGDQYEVLTFRDLIEVKLASDTDIELEVELRNPEYDITRAVKKVLYAYQGGGDLFSHITRPVNFTAYVSPADKLAEPLAKLRETLKKQLEELQQEAGDKFRFSLLDPDADGGATAKAIRTQYGFKPMALGLLDPNTFWFYMVMEDGSQSVQIPLPEDLGEASLKRAIEAGLKRFAKGLLRTVALVLPTPVPTMPQLGLMGGSKNYDLLKEKLKENANILETDLASGRVPADADLLMVVAPSELDDKQLFAIDQFLMQGGTVMVAASPFDINLQGALSATRKTAFRIGEWLKHHGLELADRMVLDPQNTAFPIPIQRNLGGFVVQEVRMVEYPYFIDIREDGMNTESGIFAGLPQINFNWAAPIGLDEEGNKERRITRLLHSSEQSWTSGELNMQPDFAGQGPLGFAPGNDRGRKLLGVIAEGRFTSWFKDKPSPLLKEQAEEKKDAAEKEEKDKEASKEEEQEDPVVSGVIEQSPESARIILFSSDTFLADEVIDLATQASGNRYLNTVQLMENAVDWSLEDRGLLSIRSRAHFARVLAPLERGEQMFWEYLNYGLALFGLLVIYLVRRLRRKRRERHYDEILELGRASA